MFRCVLIGRGTLLLRCAAQLLARGHVIAAVIGDDEEVQLWSQFAGIPWSGRVDGLKDLLGKESPDYLFSINNLTILKDAVLKTALRGAVNLHDAPLPRYAGLYVSTWALLNKEKSHGITWHMMEPGIDTGAILIQKHFAISPDETTFSLNLKIHRATEDSFGELVQGLESGTLAGTPQDLSQRTYFSAGNSFPGNTILDWHLPSAELELRVRALDFGFSPNPWKGPHLWTGQDWILARSLTILKNEALGQNGPGIFMRCDRDGLVISTADALVKVGRLVSLEGQYLEAVNLAGSLGWTQGQLLPSPPSFPSSLHSTFSKKENTGDSIFNLPGFLNESEPEKTAVQTIDGRCWSRRELRDRINYLAGLLTGEGLRPEEKIGICIPRSPEMVAGLFAILKAGGAYVPLDPSLPGERLAFMAREAGIQTVLVTSETQKIIRPMGLRLVPTDDHGTSGPAGSHTPRICGKNAAYLLYTSGSTGKPKGVLVEHRAVARYIRAAVADFDYTEKDRILQFASLNFDTAGEEIYAALASRAVLVLRSEEMISSTQRFLKTCGEQGITVLNLPTSYWHELVRGFDEKGSQLPACIRLVIIGGESARPDLLEIWRRKIGNRVRLVNTYGATELSMVSSHHELAGPRAILADANSPAPTVPIGIPIGGSYFRILDAVMDPVPSGTWGELYVGGTGLARGYWGRPDLNRSKFVADPFAKDGRLFRTGDRARLNENKVFEAGGRMDFQIKWKGHRIEPEEIEQALLLHPGIRDAVAVLEENEGFHSHLVVYLVCNSGKTEEISQDDLLEFLNSLIPSWMLPSAFIFLDHLPLNNSQKIDRAALPAWKNSASYEKHPIPDKPLWTSETEQKLASLWQKILPVGSFLPEDNFFKRGGDSLLAIHLLNRIEEEFATEIPVSEFLKASTLRSLAESIERAKENGPDYLRKMDGFRHLVLLRKGEDGVAPLILLPGGPGTEKELLCHAGWTGAFPQPFRIYGLCARSHDTYSSVEEMAAVYALEIQRITESTSCSIIGECLAAPLAFEICRQLEESGRAASCLLLLDSRYPSLILWKQRILHFIQSKELKKLKSKTRQRLRVWQDRFQKSPWKDWPVLASNLWQRQGARILGMFYLASPEHFIKDRDFMYSRYIRLLQAYRIPDRSLQTRIVLILSGECDLEWKGRTGWESKTSGDLNTVVLPGSHLNYLGGNIQAAVRAIEEACFVKDDNRPSAR